MNNLSTVLCIGLVTLVFSLVLKSVKPEYALTVQIIGLVAVAIISVSGIYFIKQRFEEIFRDTSVDNDVINFCFKLMGICYISNFASNVCKDSGHTALSVKIETYGKILIVIMTLPLIESIVKTVVEMIG